MEKVTDKSAESLVNGFWVKWADQQVFDIGVTYSVKSIALRFAQAYGEYKHEAGKRAGMEEAARIEYSSIKCLHRTADYTSGHMDGWKALKDAIRAIAQPEQPKCGFGCTDQQIDMRCILHAADYGHEVKLNPAPAAARIGECGESLGFCEDTAHDNNIPHRKNQWCINWEPAKGREEVPDEKSGMGRLAKGASEAEVKDALLASEVPHIPIMTMREIMEAEEPSQARLISPTAEQGKEEKL